MKTLRLFTFLLLGVLGLLSCQPDTETAVPMTQLEKQLHDNPQYSTFYAGLRKTGLLQELKPTASLTVLAPDNDAFARLAAPYQDFTTAARINALTDAGQLQQLRELLQYHLLPEQPLSRLSVFGKAEYPTLLAAPSPARRNVHVARFDQRIVINGISGPLTSAQGTVVEGGVLQPVSQVVVPAVQSLAELLELRSRQPITQHTLFWQALQRPAAAALLAELTSPQTDYTVLVPNDEGLRAEWQRQNAAWTTLAAVPDAALLRTLRLHILPQHRTSLTLLGDEYPTLAGSTWDTMLNVQGSFDTPGQAPMLSFRFTVSTTQHAGQHTDETAFVLVDDRASNGVLHLLDNAIKP